MLEHEKMYLTVEGNELLIHVPFRIVAEEMQQRFTPGALRIDNLTEKERQVLDQILVGKCNKEIAEALGLSLRTVKFHVSGLLKKIKVLSRYQLLTMYGKARE